MKKIYHGMPDGPEAIESNFEELDSGFKNFEATGKLLWSGNSVLNAEHRINLGKSSEELNRGIVMVFAPLQKDPLGYDLIIKFVPKQNTFLSKAPLLNGGNRVCFKRFQLSKEGVIVGHSSNVVGDNFTMTLSKVWEV